MKGLQCGDSCQREVQEGAGAGGSASLMETDRLVSFTTAQTETQKLASLGGNCSYFNSVHVGAVHERSCPCECFVVQTGSVAEMRGSPVWEEEGITAAVAQHTLQSLNTAGRHNEGPSPTACACV